MLNRTSGYGKGTGFGSIATICLLLIALWIAMGVHSDEVFGAEQLEYLDEKGNSAYIDDYTVLTESTDTIGIDGGEKWYVVQDDLEPTSKVITVKGTVKLLLTNGSSLSTELISVTVGNRLEVYAQSTDETEMGTLQCQQKTLGGSSAAIGGDEREGAGVIYICGGHVSAKAKAAAAIGGGVGQKSGLVAIKAGVVKASSDDPSTAVIGGAKEGLGGNVYIDGGKVEVTGGGTGIGAGRQSKDSVAVSISGGTVTAQGDGNGYVAIGADQTDGNKPGAGANVAIGGGNVTAISSNTTSGIGIGSKKGAKIRINGGTVEARGKDAGVGVIDPEGTEITIGWKDYTDSYYADSVKGSVKFDSGDRFIYKVEPGNIYTGSKDVDPSSIDEKSTIIPYAYKVQYAKGEQGTGGEMPTHGANPNHDFYLPECDFTCADDYVFYKWKIGDKEYDAKDKVKFDDTMIDDPTGDKTVTVTATWTKKGIPLKVSNIKAKDKIFDGKIDATFDCSEAVLDGLVEGDSVTVSAEGSFANPFAGNDKDVFIEKITLQGDAQEKYTINVDGSQKSAKASIKKRPLILYSSTSDYCTATPENKEYDGTTDAKLKFSDDTALNNAVNGYGEVYIDKNNAEGCFSSQDAGEGKEVSLSKVNLYGAYAKNYDVDLSKLDKVKIETANITPKKVDLKYDGDASKFTYNGKKRFPMLTVYSEQLIGEDQCQVQFDDEDGRINATCVRYSDDGKMTALDEYGKPAVPYYVQPKSLSNTNYAFKNGEEDYALNICKKPITIKADDKNCTDLDKTAPLTWTMEDEENNWYETERADIALTVTDDKGTAIDPKTAAAGKYKIVPSWKTENRNYEATFVDGSFDTGHKYGEWTKHDATQHQRVCEHDNTHIEKEDHKWDAGKVTTPAAEQAEGVKTYTCTVCKATRTETIPETGVQEGKRTVPAQIGTKGRDALLIGWKDVEGAEGYDIFFAKCNHKKKKWECKVVKTIDGGKNLNWTQTGLKKGTSYKFYVRAYVMENGVKKYIGKSPMMHAYAGGSSKKYTNAKSVKIRNVKKGKLSLAQGKTFKIKASVKKLKKNKKLMPKSHVPTLRYMTSDSSVATVSKSGKIIAKGSGTCYIYVYAHNGVSKNIKVTVK